jgi:hypothetical protein
MTRDPIVNPHVRSLLACCVVLALAGAAPAARAGSLVWSADTPFASGNTIAVDFGATLSGITGLEAVVTGIGGVQHWTIYQGVGNPTGTVPFEMFLSCAADGGGGSVAAASSWLPILEPFADSLAFAPAGDWTFLQDGALTLAVNYVHGAFPDVPMCYGTGYTLPVVEHLDLIVTFDSAVPTEGATWGAVKSTFR